MTIKDAKTAAEIAANCKEAWWLIGLSLKTGVVLRPKDMTNAAWDRAIRYMESRALAAIDPITGAYKLQGALADQLFGEKKAKPKKEKAATWKDVMVKNGGVPDHIDLLIDPVIDSSVADFYRMEVAKAFVQKPESGIREEHWPEAYKQFHKYVKVVGLIWGQMGKFPLMKNVLSLPVDGQLSFDSMGIEYIKASPFDQVKEVLLSMENNGLAKYKSVPLTLNNWLKIRRTR